MRIRILQVPYDCGQRAVRMGRGPLHLVERGLADRLRDGGHEVEVELIETGETFPSEIKVTFDLQRRIADRVRAAVATGAMPIILGGNCNYTVGAIAGLDPLKTGLVWFDAHGEFNTPETTVGGFLDGMGLAIGTGRCWRPLAATIPGFRPIPDSNIVLIGGRDFDAEELRELQRTQMTLVDPDFVKKWGTLGALMPTLAALHGRIQDVYVHLDLDVLDPKEATANMWAVDGGLTIDQVDQTLRLIRKRFVLRGVGLGSFDPEADHDGRALNAAFRLIDTLCAPLQLFGGAPASSQYIQ